MFLSYISRSLVSEKMIKRVYWLLYYFRIKNNPLNYGVLDLIKELIDDCLESDIIRFENSIEGRRESKFEFLPTYAKIIFIRKSINNI